MKNRISPKSIIANGLWNPFTGCKKFQITCGECSHTYFDKIPCTGVDEASSICPCCDAQNVWSLSEWIRGYESMIENLRKNRR
jgi:hypothetical protein